MMRRSIGGALALCGTALLTAVAARYAQSPRDDDTANADVQASDPREYWNVEEGFVVTVDAEGFNLPTAIAFVPSPGAAPKDPLYFVTEIRGTVKVVTNDRSVETFASDFVKVLPARELPANEGQIGVAGLCLDPENGYVFVTFAYPDSSGILRNNIVRFQSKPRTFSLRASGQVDFRHVFANSESAISHQIGGCQVSGGHLYVGVADGLVSGHGQDQTTVLGKVLRLMLDGQAVASNPFYGDAAGHAGASRPSPYIWAYGLRNPFGVKVVDGQLYVAENGNNIDRFLRVDRGGNYGWDGSDLSLMPQADLVISPSIGPVQLEFAGDDSNDAWPSSYGDNFFMATSAERRAGIMRFRYDRELGRAVAKPEFLLRYRPTHLQIVSGVALGPDGVYAVHILPDPSGRTAILRLHYDPESAPPAEVGASSDIIPLMDQKGCLSCHVVMNEPGSSVGPRLDRDSLWARLSDRLDPKRYRHTVAELQGRTTEPFVSWREERAALLTTPEPERILHWTTYKILEPRFDDAGATMPQLGLTRAEAEAIASFLVAGDGSRPPNRLQRRALEWRRKLLPTPLRVWHMAVVGVIGFAAGMAVAWMTSARRRRA